MITNKEILRKYLSVERDNYFPCMSAYIKAYLLGERNGYVWRYQQCLRKLEYYKNIKSGGVFRNVMFAYYSRKVNKLGTRLGIETWCNVFGEGLLIYHVAGGIVVNSNARIGKNCHLHGNNCIGNNGKEKEAPIIGDNCTLGVGAKVIGSIKLGNDINIAAGAVVVKSCIEDGVTLAGVPAEIIKRK